MKAKFIFSLTIVFVLVSCATPSYAQPSVDYFQRGFRHYEKGNYDLAIHDLTEAIRRNQNDMEVHSAYSIRGYAYVDKGEYDLAIRDYNETIHLDPNHPHAYNNRKIAIRARNEKAETKLREAEKARQREAAQRKAAELKRAQRKAEAAAPRMKPTQVSWRAPQKTRILSVGVGDFKDNAIPKIDYAESDALGFASLIRSSGIPEENISHLTNKDACRNDIIDALIKLKMATTESSETAIFYFSGHGAPIVKNGKIVDAALVPYDAGENSLEYTGIKISTLQ